MYHRPRLPRKAKIQITVLKRINWKTIPGLAEQFHDFDGNEIVLMNIEKHGQSEITKCNIDVVKS